MHRPNRITIVVVTFNKDFNLLKTFLHSVYRHWSPTQIESIKVILNDEYRFLPDFKKVIADNRHPNFRIDEIFCLDLEPRLEDFDWHSQQLFKCVVADYVTTDWYLIHDCKDHYCANVSLDDCFTDDGRAIMHLDHRRVPPPGLQTIPTDTWGVGPFIQAYNISCKMFDVSPNMSYRLPYLTPFLVNTSVMRDMVKELRSSFNILFPWIFSIHLNGAVLVTEFLLYNAYCVSKNGLGIYEDWQYNHRKFHSSVIRDLNGRKTDGSRIFSNNQ